MNKKPTLPEGMTVRPAGWADLEAVLALMNAVDIAVYGEPDSDLVDLRDSWRDLNLLKDTWLVEDQTNLLVGYAAVFPDSEEVTMDFLTAPEAENSELSRYLLTCCQRRTHDIRAINDGYPVRANTIVPHASSAERELLEINGYKPRKYYFQMQIELDAAPEPPLWPKGAEIRLFIAGSDDLAVYEFIQNAFTRPGYQRPTFERWSDFMIGSGRFDPNLWFLLVTEDAIIGAVLCFDYGDLGWIRQLGVAPNWRNQGLGSALLQHAFKELHKRDRPRIALGVSAENPTAIGLYQRVGMKVFRQYDEYFKVLAA